MGWEGLYEVSSHGRVRSLERYVRHSKGGVQVVKPRVMTQFSGRKGHRSVVLSEGGSGRRKYVHRLVAYSFLGQPPSGKPLALHWDGNPANNHMDNLRWGDNSDNMQDAVRHGTHVTRMRDRTHCPAGHEYSESNTYIVNKTKSPERRCITCTQRQHADAKKRGLAPGDRQHGTARGYSYFGCRCEPCKAAKRKARKGEK